MKSKQFKRWLDGRRPINVIKRPDGSTVIVFVGGKTITPSDEQLKKWQAAK